MELCYFILWFVFYSLAGWVYETILCSAVQKKFVNRGFLNGPFCPIYGFGALLVLLILGRFRNPLLLFLLGMLLTCTLEYFTSWLMEVCFHARWWDYSSQKFQINGRVCLKGAVAFGAFSMVLILFIHPLVSRMFYSLPQSAALVLSAALLVMMSADFAVTTVHILKFNDKLREVQSALDGFREDSRKRAEGIKRQIQETFENSRFYNERVKGHLRHLNFQERRMLRAFPKLRSMDYNEALQKMKTSFEEKLAQLRSHLPEER